MNLTMPGAAIGGSPIANPKTLFPTADFAADRLCDLRDISGGPIRIALDRVAGLDLQSTKAALAARRSSVRSARCSAASRPPT